MTFSSSLGKETESGTCGGVVAEKHVKMAMVWGIALNTTLKGGVRTNKLCKSFCRINLNLINHSLETPFELCYGELVATDW